MRRPVKPGGKSGRRGRIFFLFLDGVGIGRKDPAVNPFFAMPLPGFGAFMGGAVVSIGKASRSGRRSSVRPIDATLGVGGLPQSGTGQTTLLTGENAARLLGRHFGPFPHTALRDVLRERNIFHSLARLGLSTMYLNAFPGQYTDHIRDHPARTGAISLAWRSNGSALNTHDDLIAGRALSSDVTSEGWERLGYPGVPVVTPEGAAEIALRSLRVHDFVMFEYYLTDHAGHGRSRRGAEAILSTLDRFVGRFFLDMDHAGETFIMTSDHGNIEDLSTKQHTLNPVPFVCAGLRHAGLARRVRSLADIAPAILEYYAG
jgi:2,3-bisphosphoglycerate-independent phosphoglycerate mutase